MTFDTRIGADSAVTAASWQDAANASPSLPTPPQSLPTTGDGQFSDVAAGTVPQRDLDLQLAQMSNDSYTLQDADGVTGTKSGEELAAAGWDRLEPNGDHLVDDNGNRVEIDPASLEDSASGFRASIYRNDAGQVVVAFAGTDPSEMPDIGADAAQAFGLETTQYNKAVDLAKKAEVAFGDGNVVFTGHSLGGGLASTAALAVDATAVTFNSAAPSNDTLRDLGFSPNETRAELEDSGQIRHYIVDGDPLNLAQSGIPALPIPVVGPLSPPDAVGHTLRIELPEGMRPIIDSHGGGGDGTSYVEALRTNTPYASGSEGNLVTDVIGHYGDFRLNALGTVAETLIGAGTDLVNETKETVADVKETIAGDGSVIEKVTGVVGDVADGALDATGAVIDNVADGAGDLVQESSDFVGNLIRDGAKSIGRDGAGAFVARGVEGLGDLANAGLDALGNGADWVADKAGDVLEVVSDFAGSVTQTVVDGAVVVGTKVAEGAAIVADVVVEGAKTAAGAVVDGVTAAADAVVTGVTVAADAVVGGAKAVGGAISDGASWVADKLKFW